MSTIAPWETSLENRVVCLNQRSPKSKVVYIYPRPDSSTFRYRVYNMIQSLSYGSEWEGHFFYEYELDAINHLLNQIDILVFVRTPWTIGIQNILSKAKSHGIPLLLDVDDLVFDVEKVPFIMNSLRFNLEEPKELDYWFAYCSRIWSVGNQMDGLIGTNTFLSQEIQRVFKKPVHSIHNFLNDEQIAYSAPIFAKRSFENPQTYSLGYFSGSHSHANDFGKIVPELAELLHTHQNLTLNIVGYMEPPTLLKPFNDAGRIKRYPLVDFLTLQKIISEVNINLVPLVDNEFTNCKSELKFFEAAIVGTLTCATPTYTYSQAIQNGKTGYLCNQGDWFSRISEIINHGIDPAITSSAKQYCLENYAPTSKTEEISRILEVACR